MAYLSLLLLGLLTWAIFIYNRLVRDRNRVFQAWSDIAVQLKRRRDLVPKLVDAVRAYADYERSTIEVITRLRGEAEQLDHPEEIAQVERDLGIRLRKLLAVAEAYPDLKASDQFLTLLRQLSEVEDHIQFARRYYNGSVRNLNVRIDSFPDLLVARPFGFVAAEFFELEDPQEKEPPEIA
ncbi:MAG: LemA family protein [Gammaproteobacteria bacterium]|nr:LemA family protein [Gammaproteobacteria bacterium]MBU1654928.1 LemA family protein [Gammaproteobacteria bacterium]MBU1962383.1 LemA family protein [Gammaproteobacteria bacterium]